jgi:hypothetical protein
MAQKAEQPKHEEQKASQDESLLQRQQDDFREDVNSNAAYQDHHQQKPSSRFRPTFDPFYCLVHRLECENLNLRIQMAANAYDVQEIARLKAMMIRILDNNIKLVQFRAGGELDDLNGHTILLGSALGEVMVEIRMGVHSLPEFFENGRDSELRKMREEIVGSAIGLTAPPLLLKQFGPANSQRDLQLSTFNQARIGNFGACPTVQHQQRVRGKSCKSMNIATSTIG